MHINNLFDKIVAEVFSEMGFIDAVFMKDVLLVDEIVDPIIVKILVQMPFMGDVVIIAPKSLVQLLEKNLFGNIESKPVDALSEFLNIIVGKVLQCIYPDILFELGIPEEVKNKKKFNFPNTRAYVTDNQNYSFLILHGLS